jgi:DNA-binding response OmpR family regulator
MIQILMVTVRPEALHSFAETLSSDPEVRIEQAASGADTLTAVRASSPHLVLIDHELPDVKPFDLVKELLLVNAMVSTAVVSSLSEREFHEASEGLGVLASLPLEPGRGDAAELLDKLRKVLGQAG